MTVRLKTIGSSNLAWCDIEIHTDGALVDRERVRVSEVTDRRNKLAERLSESADQVTAEPIPDLTVHPNFQCPELQR